MKLKAVLDTLDGLDEAIAALYTQKGDNFVLNIEQVDSHPDVAGLKNSLAAARAEKKTLEATVTDLNSKFGSLPDDFSVDEYNRLKDGGTGNIDQRLVDQRNRLAAEKDAAVKKAETERDSYKSRVEKLASENAINAALGEANIAPHMQKAVRAMFQSQIKVGYEADEAIVTIENLPVVDKIKAWAGTEEGKYFVAAPANGGGGGDNKPANGGDNAKDNPWSKEGFNLTKQMDILKTDPARAAQLKAAAGK
jgi:hypothetical protein